MISRGLLACARFCSAAWVGAAALFVTIGVRQVTSGQLDSATIDRITLLRFPLYYLFGFALVAAAFAATLLAGRSRVGAVRRGLVLMLLAGSLGLMTYDWFQVYQPLVRLVTPPGQARTPQFTTLHTQSKYVNATHVGLVLFAAVLLAWPGRYDASGRPEPGPSA
jgi:hypothetical protein